ncbi:probable ubiquitin-like-specific protease 2A isoform X1 [Tanacetum coccineum]|uniref:Probable ubiquitin-like-specific protease 2A isoform X1 n=1 Tax=Tanacetum coccineum TaxID=301880 RepID=A0ABQ5DQ98_9ASTR
MSSTCRLLCLIHDIKTRDIVLWINDSKHPPSPPPPTPLPRYQKWTTEEEDALCAGVEKHGFGNWLAILTDSQFTSSLANKSNINLKDKWRTLSKSSDVSNNKKKVIAHRIDDLMHPHQHSTKKISEKRKVEAVSDSQDCPVKEASDPQDWQVKEVSDPQDCPVDEVSDPQDFPVEEVSDSQDCPADVINETHGCPFDEVSDSQHCPVDELWLSFSEDKKSSFTHIDPLWYNLYLNDSNKEKVLNWIKKKDIFFRKYVFFPIFQWGHWSVLIFCHFGESFGSKLKTPCILLLDSLEKADHSKQLETAIRKFVLDIYGISERKEDKDWCLKCPFWFLRFHNREIMRSELYALYYIKLFVETAPESFSTSGGYPYFMKINWFNSEGLDSFRKALESSEV